jgi:hypothetical protein
VFGNVHTEILFHWKLNGYTMKKKCSMCKAGEGVMDLWPVDKLYKVLADIDGHRADKIEAESQLFLLSPEDNHQLRARFMQVLQGEYKRPEAENHDIDRIRAWLLSMLGRLGGDDAQTVEFIKKHLLPESPDHDPDEWTRYWALEGLLANCSENRLFKDRASLICERLVPLVDQIVEQGEKSDLVLMTCYAIQSCDPNSNAWVKIKANLESGEEQRAHNALRALRIIPLHGRFERKDLFDDIARVVSEGRATDSAYSAVHALGMLSPDCKRLEEAAQVLVSFIVYYRRSQLHDGLRSRALVSLGNLKNGIAVPTVLNELVDHNPAITRDAARALQSILGVPTAVARVVEEAAKTDEPEYRRRYARGLRYMMPEDQVVDALEEVMLSGKQDLRRVAEDLLSRVGGVAAFEKLRVRRKIMDEYWQIMSTSQQDVQKLFDASLKEAQDGYKLMMDADKLRYHLGLAVVGFVLVLIGIGYLILSDQSATDALIAGLTSLIGGFMVFWFERMIDKPRRLMQDNIARIMRQKAVYLAYLRQLYQIDQAYALEILSEDHVTLAESSYFNKAVSMTMDVAVQSLDDKLPEALRAEWYKTAETAMQAKPESRSTP